MGFWSSILSVFGIGKKKKKIETEEKDEVVQEGEIKETKKVLPDKITEEYEENEQEKNRTEELKDKIEKEDKKRNLREKTLKAKVEYISSGLKERWVDQINPSRGVFRTQYFETRDKLEKSRYDIYRNVIMKAIKDDKLAEKIYRSGLISERIVARIKVLVDWDEKGKRVERILYYEAQGITPEMVLNSNIFEECKNWIGNSMIIRNNIERSLGTQVSEGGEAGKSEMKVKEIYFSFDYA